MLFGEASYGLYLLHDFIILFMNRGGQLVGVGLAFWIALTLALIALVSLGVYTYFEVPARAVRRLLQVSLPAPNRRTTMAFGGASAVSTHEEKAKTWE